MSSVRIGGCVALFLELMIAPVMASASTPGPDGVDADRPVGHRMLLGAGATWTEPGRFQHTVYPGAMLGFDLALGRYAAVGLLSDFTYIDERPEGPPPVSTNHRMIIGLDFKLLPLRNGLFRPWLMVGAAGSVVHDTGYGWEAGAGTYFSPATPTAFFLDLRRDHFADMENPAFDQVMLRVGVAF